MRKLAPFFVALLFLPACNPLGNDEDDPGPIACTAQFVLVEFWVVDDGGMGQEGFSLTVTNLRTGELYDVEQYSYEDGQYTALHDGFQDEVFGDGDPIQVHGDDGRRTFDADFVIGADRCHIEKVSGPDTVVVD